MMAAKMEELNLTTEEMERFRSAFQDARFREMFAQYAEEISNPENRRRYEQEIAEMERERGVDVQFLNPLPGHVLHTSMDGRRNCYLNICSNDLVGRARCVPGTDQQGRSGQHWSLPCYFSPAREELGPEGVREVIYDITFHPETLRLAARSDKFKAMVDQTALDTITQNFSVVLDASNVHTLSEKYRGAPHATIIRRPRPGAQPKPQDPSDPLSFPYPYNVHGGVKKSHQDQPKAGKIQLRTADPQPPQEPTIPRYTIRHRSYVDMQDYRDARDSAPSPVPKELVITIDLPLLTSTSGVALHIEGKELSLESQKPAYRLHLKLPYLVQEDQGSAQFNKIKRQLVVTVPVVQQSIPKLIPDLLEETDLPGSPAGTRDGPPSEKDLETGEPVTSGDAHSAIPEISPECPMFTCSQDATSLTLVIHAKDVDEHSITSEVSSYQCEIRFFVRHTSMPHVLFVEFLPQYNLNTNDIAVRVSKDNTVIELTKSSECFGLWKNLYFGVDSNSLQERRFINEDNVAEFLESGLRPSTIPWSTLEDQPLINVLQMNDESARIRLHKPELEERYLAHMDQYTDLSKVKKKIQYESDDTEGGSLRDPLPTAESGSPSGYTPSSVGNNCPSDQRENPGAEDEGLVFKDLPPSELDEDDLPAGAGQNPALPHRDPAFIPKEADAKDGGVQDPSDHKTQCAFRFDNALLFDLD